MATTSNSPLQVKPREQRGSRVSRRIRRSGDVPAVVYGGEEEPLAVQIESRLLRQALAHPGAVLDLKVGRKKPTPVVVKEVQRHPVTSNVTHVDLLRVRLDQPIHATVAVELVNGSLAPGVKAGGVLEQHT